MLILILFAFIAGIVTILSPCILPILPIILSGSVTGGKRKPLGIVTGFVASFTFFTLFLSTLVRSLNISADALRTFSIVVIFVFGVSLIIPQVQLWIEMMFSRISGRLSPKQTQDGFMAGVLIGMSLGLLWTPCVGPILASVITLALSGSVTSSAVLITLAYSLGTAIPMLLITYSGQRVFQKVPWLLSNTGKIQKAFGVVMIAMAVALYFNVDRKFQIWVLDQFPSYGTGLTSFENIGIVQEQLDNLMPGKGEDKRMGRPTFELQDPGDAAPEIITGGQWFNLPEGKDSLTMAELRGKVVLVDFWTYSCINCIRTLPYLRSWDEKYRDDGLVIIGVHSPEFEFEKNPDNLAEAIADFELKYPVVQDNNFETWRAYGDNRWPRKYLVDKNGYIRYFHAGEGRYDETERAIQLLLAETGAQVSEADINNPDYDIKTRTPELYLGAGRIQYLASPEDVAEGELQTYTHPNNLPLNTFSYQGEWVIGEEQAMPSAGAELDLHFDAQQVFLVMRPKNPGESGQVELTLDGLPVLGSLEETDVEDGIITVDKDRLYKLIHMDQPGEAMLKLKFLDDNIEIYAFTFG